MAKTGCCRSSMVFALVPFGCHVSCGASFAQPARNAVAASPETPATMRRIFVLMIKAPLFLLIGLQGPEQ